MKETKDDPLIAFTISIRDTGRYNMSSRITFIDTTLTTTLKQALGA